MYLRYIPATSTGGLVVTLSERQRTLRISGLSYLVRHSVHGQWLLRQVVQRTLVFMIDEHGINWTLNLTKRR
jgi:hypothetical protein